MCYRNLSFHFFSRLLEDSSICNDTHKKRQLFRFVWLTLFNICFPVTLSCDSACVLAIAWVWVWHFSVQKGALKFLSCLSHALWMRRSGQDTFLWLYWSSAPEPHLDFQLFGLPEFGDYCNAGSPFSCSSGVFHRLVPSLTFFPFFVLFKAEIKM